MTPKEKAIELFDTHMGFKMNPYDDIEMTLKKGIAKKHALIAVDEILDILWHTHKNEIEYRFWQQVEQEIQAL